MGRNARVCADAASTPCISMFNVCSGLTPQSGRVNNSEPEQADQWASEVGSEEEC
jgi:hypothetical protein